MYRSIEELMEAAHCSKWPQRWNEIYDQVMADFDQNGCRLCFPDYYDRLSKDYGTPKKHLELYKKAAQKVKENEALARLLSLLCFALEDTENAAADLKEFSFPKEPNGVPDLAYDMLEALAVASQLDGCNEILTKRGIPDDIRLTALQIPENGVDEYQKRHNGLSGFNLFGWYQLVIKGYLFRIGRLEIELFAKFPARACVFQNAVGDLIALAHDFQLHKSGFALGAKNYEDEEGSWLANVIETDTHWIGHPFDEKGFAKKDTVSLDKREWKKLVSKGDPIISLHIPPDGRLSDEDVERTIAETRAFANTYFPDFEYKAMVCSSWLVDPQLVDMLGENSNISKFCKRFKPISAKASGDGIFYFVFKTDAKTDLNSLPESTSLERKLKEHYLSGKVIYEMHGYFI